MTFSLQLLLTAAVAAGTLAACTSGRPATPASTASVPAAAVLPPPPAATSVVPLYQAEAFTVWPDRVEQAGMVARAESATQITSTYQSPASATFNRQLEFKFALNGRDNELPIGVNHRLTLLPGAAGRTVAAPVIVFGQKLNDERPAPPEGPYLEPDTRLKLRLDLRPVLAAFKKQGHFDAFNGQRIYQQDFKGVFVAGGSEPLGWDFDNLAARPQYQLQDPDGDGLYEIELLLNPGGGAVKTEPRTWKLTQDLTALPQYHSGQPLVDALWNLSLEEMLLDIRPDQTFMAGAKWDGVWTRDISYSIVLSLAHLRPDIAMNSLRRKVTPDGRIIQDTGTGGSWPCSSDRLVWALAAWEVYLETGDRAWLREAATVISKSLQADAAVVASGGLVRGESSFLDWRQQTYPRWMQPADIYEARALGTNALYVQALRVMALMRTALGESSADATAAADKLAAHVNEKLWNGATNYYGQYRYGPRGGQALSPRWEALGEALCILHGIADGAQAGSLVQHGPRLSWGTPTVWPMLPGIPPYHNQSVWPFVQAYWTCGAARANAPDEALTWGLACLYRPAALFLTNKENVNALDGDFKGTEINSDRQLWSVAGTLASVTRVLFGMAYAPDQLTFRPVVPAAYAGEKTLRNFRYRAATLTIQLRGTGRTLRTATLDGQPLPTIEGAASVPANLTGAHALVLELANDAPAPVPSRGGRDEPHWVQPVATPETPLVQLLPTALTWAAVENAVGYVLYQDGQRGPDLGAATKYGLPATANAPALSYYQVLAVDADGRESFLSEPVEVVVPGARQHVKPTAGLTKTGPGQSQLPGFTGGGFVLLPKEASPLSFEVRLKEAGRYEVEIRYANGSGPVNTDNKCALRTLYADGQRVGPIVMPQRGAGEWANWGYSNALRVPLTAGVHRLELRYDGATDANMNAEGINTALIDELRLTRTRDQRN